MRKIKINPKLFAGVMIALLILLPLSSVMTIRYEPLLGNSHLASIFKKDIFVYVCATALYAIGCVLTELKLPLIKQIWFLARYE